MSEPTGSAKTSSYVQKAFKKLLKGSGELLCLDSTKLMVEKISRDGWYTRELRLLQDLIKKKMLSLDLFNNPVNTKLRSPKKHGSVRICDFSSAYVAAALDELKSGQNIGKPVVEITRESVAALKTRVSGGSTPGEV